MIIYIIKNIMSSKHAIDIHKNQEYHIQVMNFFMYLYIYIYHRNHEYQAILASDKLTRGLVTRSRNLGGKTLQRLPREKGGRLIEDTPLFHSRPGALFASFHTRIRIPMKHFSNREVRLT